MIDKFTSNVSADRELYTGRISRISERCNAKWHVRVGVELTIPYMENSSGRVSDFAKKLDPSNGNVRASWIEFLGTGTIALAGRLSI